MKKIVLTGGGTAGHVTPNIALFDELKKNHYKIFYIGSKNGMEKGLIEDCGIPYYGISSGKLRRYLDVKNFTDAFRVIKGFADAVAILKKLSPHVVFSKGGFVTVPVVLAARFLKIPVVLHESDITPGLANRIAMPFANKVCAAFPETMEHLDKNKAVLTGTPIRKVLFEGDAEKGRQLCKFQDDKPVILMMGGSQGSVKLNECLREALPKLIKSYNVVHLCGKGNLDVGLNRSAGYAQFEYLKEELGDVIALSDVVVSRAGANSICEFLALKKPNLLIPLSKNASRGDQILNAESFLNQGFSKVIYEENLNTNNFVLDLIDLYTSRELYIQNMENSKLSDGVSEVIKVIRSASK